MNRCRIQQTCTGPTYMPTLQQTREDLAAAIAYHLKDRNLIRDKQDIEVTYLGDGLWHINDHRPHYPADHHSVRLSVALFVHNVDYWGSDNCETAELERSRIEVADMASDWADQAIHELLGV